MDLITTCRGSLRQKMQKRPIAEVHMEGLNTIGGGNFFTESRINSILARDKRSKDAIASQMKRRVFQAT